MLEFVGTAEQRGFTHGRVLEQQIEERILHTLAARIPDAKARIILARPWAEAIEESTPNLAEEMYGIARGSGARYEDVVLLNAFEAFDISTQIEMGGCTSIAVSRRGGALVGQNWDANDSLAESLDVHVHRGPDTLSVAVLASPGGLGWIGLNEAGLALCNNDLVTKENKVSLPSQAVRRRMLQESTVQTALKVLTATEAPGGRAYTVGDAYGEIAMVEVAAECPPAVAQGRHKTAHSNHALVPSIRRWEDADALQAIYPSSNSRQDRALELLNEELQEPAQLRNLLEDHKTYPASICRHHTPAEPTTTAATAIFDCANKEAHFSFGNPCQNPSVTTVRLP